MLGLGVFVTLVVREPENVLRTVVEMRALELMVFEVLMLLVDVVVDEGVLVDKEHLEGVDDAVVVLEVVDVPVPVSVLKGLTEILGLAETLGEPVDVLDPIERVIVDEAELVFDEGAVLDIVGEPVLVFDILTLPVVVFVRGGVFDNLAD